MTVTGRRLEGGDFADARVSVVVEKELAIFINGEPLVTASIVPAMEREFVTGYLFGQGFVESAEDLKSIQVSGGTIRVTVRDARKILARTERTSYRIVSGGGCAAFFDETSLPKITSRIKISRENVFQAMNTLFEKGELYRETEGVHAAGLFTPEAKPLCIVEDIGRHNALDKLIGHALIKKINLGAVFLASTGRMASQMVVKIGRAGIPVAATKTAVTKAGLEIGQRCGLTIIGFVRDVGTQINTDMEVRTVSEPVMKIYTHAGRILL
jgi:FdhD protein